MLEPSLSSAVDAVQRRNSSPKEESNSTSSDPVTDAEDQEITDDDDDDRNHKHRRREARPQSFDNNVQEQPVRPNRKRSRPLENGQLFSGAYSHGDIQKEYSFKFEKQRYGMSPHDRAPPNIGLRARVNQSYYSDPASHLDLSASSARPPVGRGRGRNIVPWSQHDPRFNPLDSIDFASRMASQGQPTHPSLFAGTGLPSGASSQNGPWGAYGVIPGMTNRILDPIHPLSLQGALQPTIAPLMNLGMPRQRCRDFEERGFCLRGDMCPMEHGINRIVVEDVQSLSQFNLPVSIPSHHQLGSQARTGSIPPVNTSSALLTSSKMVPIKDNNSVGTDDASKLNEISSASAVEADVYDPDQPLWNNEQPETSRAGFRLPSLNNDDEPVWGADSSAHQGVRLSSDTESESQSHALSTNVGLQSTNSSVWGRIRSRNRSEAGMVTDTNVTSTSYFGNKMKEDHEDATPVKVQEKVATKDMALKAPGVQPHSRMPGDLGRHGGRTSQRASQTLYINGIPQKNNKREAILSHFQKFGEVIDIYIPHNSEKAFVQFSKREEAEAALKAPDAVMGNRFIKLWWANRDRIPDLGENRVNSKSVQLSNMVGSPGLSQPSDSDGGREILPFAASKASNGSSETFVPSIGPLKGLSANGSEVTHLVQKKLENLELWEELRKKQDILAQKRDEFRRQLDKLEKKTTSVKKGETVGKGKKVGAVGEDAKLASSRPEILSIQVTNQEAGCTLEKKNPGDVLISPTIKPSSTTAQQTPTSMKQTTRLPAFSQNRFKLDNRPTSFRVLPPLPAEITEVSVLKEHFSSFGDVSSLVLEDTEVCNENASLNPSQNCTACVTFATRQSAERAYATGKSWKGHILRFSWLTESPSSNNNCGVQETSTPTGASSAKIHCEQVTSETPSSPVGRSGCSAISGQPAMNVESAKSASTTVSNDLVQNSSSSHSVSSCEESPKVCDVPSNVDNSNTSFSK